MSPEYLEQLANMVDAAGLWRTPPFERDKLTDQQRAQLDAGVALRRHADHVRRLLGLIGTGKSLLITPLSASGNAIKTVSTPAVHKRLYERGGAS